MRLAFEVFMLVSSLLVLWGLLFRTDWSSDTREVR